MELTIITINYNNKSGLTKTLLNMAHLKRGFNFQYVVVDGNSSDGSVEELNNHSNIIDVFISERDEGIYDAMNKGIQLATGQYIAFINSGDLVDLNNFSSVHEEIKLNMNDIIYGDYFIGEKNKYKWKGNGVVDDLWKGYFCHQSMYVKRELLLHHPFDIKQKICGDTKFVLTAITQSKAKVCKIDLPLCIIEPGGVSDVKRIKSIISQRDVTIQSKVKSRFEIEIYFFPLLMKNMFLQVLRSFRGLW
ncbi:glycosyltransferase [Aeromonas mytilicola]